MMEIYMKAVGDLIRNRDREHYFIILMVKNMLETFKMVKNMDKEFIIFVNSLIFRLWR